VLCCSWDRYSAVQLAVHCSRSLRVVWITFFSVLWLLEQAASSEISSATVLEVREHGCSEFQYYVISSFNRIVLTFHDRFRRRGMKLWVYLHSEVLSLRETDRCYVYGTVCRVGCVYGTVCRVGFVPIRCLRFIKNEHRCLLRVLRFLYIFITGTSAIQGPGVA
jgi:hypothetical protein